MNIDEDIINELLNTKFIDEKETIQGNIYDGYKIIDDIQQNRLDKYEGLKKFLETIKTMINEIDSCNYEKEVLISLKMILKESESTVKSLIQEDPTKDKVSSELDTILIRIDEVLKKDGEIK